MRNLLPEDVWEHLAGFAPANDVGCQDFRDTDAGSMLRVKGMDGFCPIGPGIVRGVDVRKSTVRTLVNGKVVQDGPVSDMNFGIDYLLADLCRHITLLADVTMLQRRSLAMVFDRDSEKIESIKFLAPDVAVVLTREVWAMVLQESHTREPLSTVKAAEVQARYLLHKEPFGDVPLMWVVYEADV